MKPPDGASDRLRFLKLSPAKRIPRTRNRWIHHDDRLDARDLFPGRRDGIPPELSSCRDPGNRLRGARREGAPPPAPLPQGRTAKASEGRRLKLRWRLRRPPLIVDRTLSCRPPLLGRDLIKSSRPPCVKDFSGLGAHRSIEGVLRAGGVVLR